MPKFLSTFKGKLITVGFVGLNAINAMAAGVAIGADGAVTGDLELKTFMGMAGLVIVALGAMWAVKQGLRLIKG